MVSTTALAIRESLRDFLYLSILLIFVAPSHMNRMKPTRIRMCHSLVMNYGLYKKMEIFVRNIVLRYPASFRDNVQRAKPATKREMTQFHSDDYVDFLSRITPSNMGNYTKEQHKCLLILLIRLIRPLKHVSISRQRRG